MFDSIVVEGSDGVGKSTLVKEIVRQVNAADSEYEACSLHLPSNGLSGFRDFFLQQKGGSPSIVNGQLSWEPCQTSTVPPMTNMLQILGDMIYCYSALALSPHFRAIDDRGKTPLVVIDREILSTIVYQIMYPVPMEKEDADDKLASKLVMLETLQDILKSSIAGQIRHNLLVYIEPKDGIIKIIGNDSTFDNFDQTKLQRHYENVFRVLASSDEGVPGFSGDMQAEIRWIGSRYASYMKFPAFSNTTEVLAASVVAKLSEAQFAS